MTSVQRAKVGNAFVRITVRRTTIQSAAVTIGLTATSARCDRRHARVRKKLSFNTKDNARRRKTNSQDREVNSNFIDVDGDESLKLNTTFSEGYHFITMVSH